jgi:hypothetical protein
MLGLTEEVEQAPSLQWPNLGSLLRISPLRMVRLWRIPLQYLLGRSFAIKRYVASIATGSSTANA